MTELIAGSRELATYRLEHAATAGEKKLLVVGWLGEDAA